MAEHAGSVPFRFEIVKHYPPRGPLRQHRLAKATAFACGRCGGDKTAKLISTINDTWEPLLCNGCYGWLLSVWKIKSGTLDDAERETELARLLREQVTEDQVHRAKALLSDLDGRFARLSPEAMTMLATSEAVADGFEGRAATELDWSAAVIGLCKAVELEVVRLLASPLRQSTVGVDLSADRADPAFRHMVDFCTGRKHITLGQVAHFIGTLAKSPRSGGPLAQAMRLLSSRWPRSDLLFDPTGLIGSLHELTRRYRNPAAHTGVLSRSDYLACLNLVRGAHGILPQLLDAVAPVKR